MVSESDPFLQALGDDQDLPVSVLALHGDEGRYHGRCDVTRGRGALVALALRAGRFPPEGNDLPVTLNIRRDCDGWHWERDFDGHITRSRLIFDARRGCVREQIGALTIWMRPMRTETGLAIEIQRLRLFGVPCPRFLLPRSCSTESEDTQARFRFDISAHLPGGRLLIRYRGWLTSDNANRGAD